MKFRVQIKNPAAAGVWVDTIVRDDVIRAVVLLPVSSSPSTTTVDYWLVDDLEVTHFWNHKTDFWDEIGRMTCV